MESILYQLSARFHGFLFQQGKEAEPILIIDETESSKPRRILCVRYVLAQGAGEESSRPIFNSELTAYNYQTEIMYPTQKTHLERLQAVTESFMYGQSQTLMARVMVQDESTGTRKPIKVIVSEALFSKLVGLYEYAW